MFSYEEEVNFMKLLGASDDVINELAMFKDKIKE
jgi:hypothetical protein